MSDQESNKQPCPHGYPAVWRRHCRECEHEGDIAELQEIISQLTAEINIHREREYNHYPAVRLELECGAMTAEAKLEIAIKALEWYANEIQYANWPSELWQNKGERARQALREVLQTNEPDNQSHELPANAE